MMRGVEVVKLVEMCCSARPRGMCERVRGGVGVRVESGVEGAQKRNKAIDLWLFRRFAARGSRKGVRSEPWKLAPGRIGARQTESRLTEMAHSVCPYDGFAPAPILTNRLLLRARGSRDFLPSRPFEFQATHATSLRTSANSRHVARSSREGSRLAYLLPASLPSAPRDRVRGHPRPPADATVTAQPVADRGRAPSIAPLARGIPGRARTRAAEGRVGGARSDRRAMVSH